jgi:ATP adenylyltransferase
MLYTHFKELKGYCMNSFSTNVCPDLTQQNLIYPCPFCDEIQGQDNLFERLLGDRIPNRIVKSTSNFVVWPGLGPIGEGYLLILPRHHFISARDLSLNLISELDDLKKATVMLLKEVYETGVIAFEHGPSQQTAGSRGCVDHAHIHVVTSNVEYLPILEHYFNWINVGNLAVLRELRNSSLPYIYYMGLDGKEYFAIAPACMPSQFLRKIIAQESKYCINWDWRSNPQPEAVIRIYKELTSLSRIIS